ncbi:hypothetical protein JX266_006110 [Neoarthrinium moseri]|nr:hypothetical protein JX266_006110 [Neoarthrinium moseri]
MKTYQDYTVAVVFAIEFEMSALRYMLDQEHPSLSSKSGDPNDYILGELSGHDIVLAWLPGTQGNSAAAIVTTNLDRTFPNIQWHFLAGIGGGVPSIKHDIRLGDVVVSMPKGTHGGVVQYDLGKDTDNGFKLKGFLSAPPPRLRTAVGRMQSDHRKNGSKVAQFVSDMIQKSRRFKVYMQPATETDALFDENYPHAVDGEPCEHCDKTRIVPRDPREDSGPEVHYGLIASGNGVMRSAARRNSLAQSIRDILCFDMEAAGLATESSYIIIRAICDYADSHKNDVWQYYAAAVAAACTKELLAYLDPVITGDSEERSLRYSDTASKVDSYANFTGRGVQNLGGSFSVGRDMHIN